MTRLLLAGAVTLAAVGVVVAQAAGIGRPPRPRYAVSTEDTLADLIATLEGCEGAHP
jgi:hypothetical protein